MVPPRAPLLVLFVAVAALPHPAGAQESLTPVAPRTGQPPPREEARLLTLADCFALALQRSEVVAIQQELIKENEGRFLQALSGALPRASFEASKKRQDGTGGSAFTLRDVPERKFVFSQPLFSGFKEFAAMAGARAERRQRRHEEARAEQLLFVDVSDAFYLVREQREDLAALEAIRAALIGRLEELADRERLGRSRPSEVVSAKAQLRRLEAEIELVRNREVTARQLLEFLTGLARVEGLADLEVSPPQLASENEYLAKASLRPDVRAAEEAWHVAKKEARVAQASFWPDVDVEGNYYTRRVGASSGVDWDVLLTVNVPLFQGGETAGAVRTASSEARQAKLRFEQTQREAALDIQDTYATLQAAMTRHAVLAKALDASEENYRLQQEDYRLSLVNNLDVLQALEELLTARRDVIHATYEIKRLSRSLQAAVGEIAP